MKYISIGNGAFSASEIALGCMRISNLGGKEAETLVHTALEQGIDFFDHADIYGGGESEKVFADAIHMNDDVRETVFIQTKCAIHDGYYDFSKEHILRSVEGSLRRLRTDYIDVLLLHRPDALMEPEEVAEAFAELRASGKVRYFGVSNQSPYQMELLQKYLQDRLIINQLQLSLTNTGMIDAGINVNTKFDGAIDRDGGVLEYCRLKDITIQPWSPLQYGFFEGVFLGSDKYPELNAVIGELARKYDVSDTAIAFAWLLRHPAKMQPIAGTTNPQRIADICQASEVELTRKEWYDLYKAAGNKLP